eukprot:TRINITY_DN876_c0_g1_i1.p1 TRINITY_DN876_c0_g1~~TRINITY_DN876_c0_g1_i1.p1  ORF type:complete len:320 (-),score=72.86 TRINITY_DN876_c0_g1_i1:251-1210(-)
MLRRALFSKGFSNTSKIFQPKFNNYYLKNNVNNYTNINLSKSLLTANPIKPSYTNIKAIGAALLAGVGFVFMGKKVLLANEQAEIPDYPFKHKGMFNELDKGSIRRGYQIYREVCAACHSLDLIAWRNFVDVFATEDEVKEWAKEFDYPDEPNDQGEIEDRPGKLTDYMPKPYPNENAARDGNNGAYPPDLSLIKKARVGGEDYIFSLMTGYCDPPHGVVLAENQYYNPYFPGAKIAMPQPLQEDMVEYPDGTPASISQMAKDISVFLTWTAEPEHDERKKMGMKALFLFILMAIPSLYFKRLYWAPLKTRKISFDKIH